MPTIWPSSERPISVRTVWVDGIRHAILSPDDPLIHSKSRRRTRVSRNKGYSTEYQQLESRLDRLNNCFTNLQMVVSNDLSEARETSQMYRKLSAPSCSRISTSTSDTSVLESLLNDNEKMRKEYHCHKATKEESDFLAGKEIFKNNVCGRGTSESEPDFKLSITECRQTEGISDAFWNPLFERVLQWLDLSGRTQCSKHDFEDRLTERPSDEEEPKLSATKGRFPRLKRDDFEERERMAMRSCKLHKERNSERLKREGSKIMENRLPKIKNTREQFQESSGTLNGAKTFSKSEEESKTEIKEKASSNIWRPPSRLKLHVVIPSLAYKENRASSQESLMDD